MRKIQDIVDRYGQAQFYDYDLLGRRLCYKLADRLPPIYEAVVEDPNPLGGGRGALLRWGRNEVRLWVRRVGGPSRQPRSEAPHRRALGSLNRPAPPQEQETGA